MQLILETENSNLSMEEKMSTLDKELTKERSNGDVKKDVNVVNGMEHNENSNKENIETEGNVKETKAVPREIASNALSAENSDDSNKNKQSDDSETSAVAVEKSAAVSMDSSVTTAENVAPTEEIMPQETQALKEETEPQKSTAAADEEILAEPTELATSTESVVTAVENSVPVEDIMPKETQALVEETTLQNSIAVSVEETLAEPIELASTAAENLDSTKEITPNEAESVVEENAPLKSTINNMQIEESQNEIVSQKIAESSEAMEVDESSDSSFDKLNSDVSVEKDATKSITAMINDIVESLDCGIPETNEECSSNKNEVAVSESESPCIKSVNVDKDSCPEKDTSPKKTVALSKESQIQVDAITTNTEPSLSQILSSTLSSIDKSPNKSNNLIKATQEQSQTDKIVSTTHDDDDNDNDDDKSNLTADVAHEQSNEINLQNSSKIAEILENGTQNKTETDVAMETDSLEAIEIKSVPNKEDDVIIVTSTDGEQLTDSATVGNEVIEIRVSQSDVPTIKANEAIEKRGSLSDVPTVMAIDVSEDISDVTEVNSTASESKLQNEQSEPLKTDTTAVDDNDDISVIEEVNTTESKPKPINQCITPEKEAFAIDAKDDISDVEEVNIVESTSEEEIKRVSPEKENSTKTSESRKEKEVCTQLIKLSNTLDILSDDDEEETPSKVTQSDVKDSTDKQCINLDDDDDIMLIDDNTSCKDNNEQTVNEENVTIKENEHKMEDIVDCMKENEKPVVDANAKKDSTQPESEIKEDIPPKSDSLSSPVVNEKITEDVSEKIEKPKPLVPPDFFKTYRKNLADMTRDDLEEFCILKIVESIIDRSSLSEIRSKLKNMAQNIEEHKKKAMMLTKQNRDLQVVLKSVQEEQKKNRPDQPVAPLKITRSVGMQVLMADKSRRKIGIGPQSVTSSVTNLTSVNNTSSTRPVRNVTQSPRTVKPNVPQQIPVPRLVPALNSASNKTANIQQNNVQKSSPVANGIKIPSTPKSAEKRTRTQMQSQSQTPAQSVTVDLTDDEPPSKVATRTNTVPAVRVANQQNLLVSKQQIGTATNSPRKVFIPITGAQSHNLRPGQTIMLKTVPPPVARPRGPAPPMVRAPQNSVQVRRIQSGRHPAPLPDAMKQYQPPNWKALPPAPDLKLSKVENGIVISWKIDGYQEDSYEEIASYQLYAYQENSTPPSTALWKKIGDVKALPLPMACTLTQFMAGYKYYFAVRAVDVKSRLGPFSLPGSILLLHKM